MERTIRFFDENQYRTDFKAKVISIAKNDGDEWETILDGTCFFPEQGGQSPDKGILGGQIVTFVRNDDGVITHLTKEIPVTEEGKPVAVGDAISGHIDFEHRFSNMQQHSGEHLFSGILHKKFGYENVGFHLSDHVVTLDTSGPLTPEQIREVEDEANSFIFENRIVTAFFPKAEELDKYEFRSKDGIEGDVRLVEIEGVDICACCAPHVGRTGEIGILRVVDYMNYKGGTRISILCGSRALEYMRNDDAILKSLINDFSCKRGEIVSTIKKLKDDKLASEIKLRQFQAEALSRDINSISGDAENVLLFTTITDNTTVRNAVNELVAKHAGFCAIFFGDEENYRFVIGSSQKDCNDVMKVFREMGIKGGGSSAMVQGTVEKTSEEIKRIVSTIFMF